MNGAHRPDCYGRLFPDALHLPEGHPATGTVFLVSLTRPDGMVRTDRRVEVDLDQWDDCQRCPEFDGCYRLSMARLALESAVHDR